LSMMDEHAYSINHAYFEKFKSKGTAGWGGKTLFGKKVLG